MRPLLVVVSVEPLAPIVLLELLPLVDVSVLAVLLLLEGLVLVEGLAAVVLLVEGAALLVEPVVVLGLVVVLLPDAAPAPLVPGLEPVVAPVAEPPAEPEPDAPLPDVCAMDNPPMARAAAAARVVRVFLVVNMISP